MVYQPTIGLHEDVAEVDFVSMYPSIMAHFNISPETVLLGEYHPRTRLAAHPIGRGLVPETLQPLLEKRIAIKSQLLVLPNGTRAANAIRRRICSQVAAGDPASGIWAQECHASGGSNRMRP